MTASATDFDTIVPSEGTVTVAGVKCTVRRIKTRELMLTARVLTAGMQDAMGQLDFANMSANDWAAVLVSALPEAGDQFVDLVSAIVRPPDGIEEDELAAIRAELANPDPTLLLDLVPIVVEQERDTFQALVGKFQALMKLVSAPARGAANAKAKAAKKK